MSLIAVAQFQARRSGLVNMTQNMKCSKQLSVSSRHGCEQFDSPAELRVVGWDSRKQTVSVWWSLLTSSVCPASVWDCGARAQSALQAANNQVQGSLLF